MKHRDTNTKAENDNQRNIKGNTEGTETTKYSTAQLSTTITIK